jgi:hypothetical protein
VQQRAKRGASEGSLPENSYEKISERTVEACEFQDLEEVLAQLPGALHPGQKVLAQRAWERDHAHVRRLVQESLAGACPAALFSAKLKQAGQANASAGTLEQRSARLEGWLAGVGRSVPPDCARDTLADHFGLDPAEVDAAMVRRDQYGRERGAT